MLLGTLLITIHLQDGMGQFMFRVQWVQHVHDQIINMFWQHEEHGKTNTHATKAPQMEARNKKILVKARFEA